MLSQTETNRAITLNLTTLLRSGRKVISDYQDLINQKSANKSFTAEKVIAETLNNYEESTGHPLPDVDKHSEEGMMLKAELDAITEVINNVQPLINNPKLGFKGFLPAIFAYRVAQSFNKKVNNLAYLKLTAPQEQVILPSNMPDSWENQVIKKKFQSPTWEKGGFITEVATLNGRKAFRLMIPEYYDASCLHACHGVSKEITDSTGKKIQSSKWDLGGAVSAAIYLK